MTLDLTDDERTALEALLRRTINDSRYLLSPRIRTSEDISTNSIHRRLGSPCRRGSITSRRGIARGSGGRGDDGIRGSAAKHGRRYLVLVE
jgi:hypothetical protein